MEIAKRKNRRSILIKELSRYVKVSLDSFIEDIEENDAFCKRVFNKLNSIQNKTIIKGNDLNENIELAKERLKRIMENTNFNGDSIRVFFYRELEIEAVKLNVNEVGTNIDKILDIISFSSGFGDFILVGENLKLGICIERTEYYYELCSWGLE